MLKLIFCTCISLSLVGMVHSIPTQQSPCSYIVCVEIYQPVCASNGVTYGNKCRLRRASCYDPSIMSVHVGSCRNCDYVVCPYIYDPVCGTNGRTYSNDCLLRIATCRNPFVRLAYRGECFWPITDA